ncbi:MAG: VOC family protein [Propionicimonas sp.]
MSGIRANRPLGAPTWVDLMVSDLDRTHAFYHALFGWDFDAGSPDFGGYHSATLEGKPVAGLSPAMSMDGSPPVMQWTVYLATDDAEASVAAIAAHGGTLVAPAMVVGDFGTMAIAQDPGEAFFGVWQGNTHVGFEVSGVPGATAWFEEFSGAYGAARTFYQEVFGWHLTDMGGGMEYAVAEVAGERCAGIGAISPDWGPGVPAHWGTYFEVADIASACETVKEHGGAVSREPVVTPFGKNATVSGPDGEFFSLLERQA